MTMTMTIVMMKMMMMAIPNGVCRMVAEARTDRWPSVAAPGHPNNRMILILAIILIISIIVIITIRGGPWSSQQSQR